MEQEQVSKPQAERTPPYDFIEIEQRWQGVWEQHGTFMARDDDPRPKLYVLQMFPYPSGDLHAGHIRNYVLGDAVARYWRMKGYNVMHPMGFDSFGLPAEQAAIDRGVQPSEWIERCVNNSRRQFKRYGFSFDWSREVVTSDPSYYKWTQWLFLKFYGMGLIYRKQIEVNWCETHGVLANDEVKEGGCWRCSEPVRKVKMEQWCMSTTKYARRMLDGLERLPGWTHAVRTMQRNWIGESEGTNIVFDVPALRGKLPQGLAPELAVFTTRVDTIYGCTFMAIAPDHPLAQALAEAGGTSVELKRFAGECARENVQFSVAEDKPKRGLRLGVDCVNPFNDEAIPVFATNYVVSDFGTGAVMAVPAHDTRDHAFALEYGLPIRPVIRPAGVLSESGGGRPSLAAPASAPVQSALQRNRHRLPHWELSGSLYFVSWRLLPSQHKMEPGARDIVYSALKHFDGERYDIAACVVMDDHVHLLVRLFEGQELGKALHSWRSFTTNRLQRECGYQGTVWQDDYFDRIIRSEDEYYANLQYILDNPIKRWPDVGRYQWLYYSGTEHFTPIQAGPFPEGEQGSTTSADALDAAVQQLEFIRWFWIQVGEHKHLIRDYEHGVEHFTDRKAAYEAWFNNGPRPKLFRSQPYREQVAEIAPDNWATLLLGYLMLGRGATKDFLAGQLGAFGFTIAIPLEIRNVIQRAASDGRPPTVAGRPSPESNKSVPECFPDKGICFNSGPYDGMDFAAAKAAMDSWLAEQGKGGGAIQYRLRDWNLGRQRFWGAPIPMVRCDKPEEHGGCGWQPVPADSLPVHLPARADYSDIRQSPLSNDREWQRTYCPQCGGPATRDTDTMTTFMCSAWYFLRFCDSHNPDAPFDRHKVEAWLPVDYYIGGKEHAVGHLLYSRCLTMVLHDAGLLSLHKPDHEGRLPALHDEPFRRLFNQGIVYKDGAKMSKSKGNVVSSDELAEQYGADTARLFAYFGGPADMDLEWATAGVEGCHRFLRRVWRLAHNVSTDQPGDNESCDSVCRAVVRARHRAVAAVTEELSNWRFNTAIAKLMEYTNELEALRQSDDGIDEAGAFHMALLTLAQLLSPFAPHMAEELWRLLGGSGLCADSDWPEYDESLLVELTVEVPVQVNGKLRGRVRVMKDASEAEVLAEAQANEQVARHLAGVQIVKTIYVPGRMLTLVVK